MKTESIKSTDRYYPVGAGRFCCAENQPLFHTNSNSFLIMYIVDGAFTFVKNGMQISAHVGDMLYCDNPSALQSDMNSLMEELFETVTKSVNVPLDRLTQAERTRIIAQLHEQGMFELRGAVQFTVKKLSCSQASIYRYIKKAKAGENAQNE